MKLREKKGYFLIIIGILAIIASSIYCLIFQKDNIIQGLTPEQARAMTYGELTAEDVKVEGTDYVEFSAFFTRDLDDDGYAEKIKGTCKEIGEKDILYIDLNVLSEGYLKNGKITLNSPNFTWSTSIVEDTVFKGNYIGNTSTINLQDKVINGSQRLIWGNISANIGTDTTKYSKTCSVTLTGTHVIENEDSTKTETAINKTVYLPVDWYGTTTTYIRSSNENKDIDALINGDNAVVSFSFTVEEQDKELLLQKQEAKLTIPELNGYAPISAKATNTGISSSYDEDTGVLTITRSSSINNNGIITSQIANKNTYNVQVVYPKEAYEVSEDETIKFNTIIRAYNYGYNNENPEFENPYISDYTKTKTITYKEEVVDGYVWNLSTYVGKNVYNRKVEKNRYEISKELPTAIYNGNSTNDQKDNYIVKWDVDIGNYSSINNIILQEQKENNTNKTDKFNDETSMYDYVKTTGIYFTNAAGILGEDGWIKLYDAEETDEDDALIATFNASNWKNYTSNSPYQVDLKSIKIVTSKPIINEDLYVYQIKEIDDELLTSNFQKDDFDELNYIYTYLSGTIKAPEGVTYEGETTENTLNRYNYAYYDMQYSRSDIEISKDKISSQDIENVNFTIKTFANNILETDWKNGVFLIELPSEIIDIDVKSVESTKENVSIANYYTYKEDGKYFIKIYTENEEKNIFNIIINADLSANPLLATRNVAVKLYAYNENCDNYNKVITDTYDIDNDGLVTDKVGYETKNITITNIGSSGIITAEYITDYDDNESMTIAPNVAEIEKSNNEKTAKINVSIANQTQTLSEIKILGKVPYEGNTYTINGHDLGSEYTANITGPITIPEELSRYATVYYSEKDETNNNILDSNNGWRLESEFEDWTKIKTYLIDLGNYVLEDGRNKVFSYEVKVPAGLGYNSVSFSHHAVYYCLDTQNGKLSTQTEPNKVGIQVVGKYNLELTKNRAKKDNVLIKGATFSLVSTDAIGKEVTQVATTDENGKLEFNGIYIEKEYTLEEISAPNGYEVSSDKIKFKLEIKNNNPEFNVLEGEFKQTPQITTNSNGDYVVKAKLENIPTYNLEITKNKVNDNTLFVNGATYKASVAGSSQYTVTGRTNLNGIAVLTGLCINKEYTLVEQAVNTNYIVSNNSIKFIATLDNNGNIEFTVNSDTKFNGTPVLTESDGISLVKVNLEDEAKYSLKINKVGDNGEKVNGAKFTLTGNGTLESLRTDGRGEVVATGLVPGVTYQLEETKAEGYYLLGGIKSFKVVRNAEGKLAMQSSDEEMARANIVEEEGVVQAIVNVTIENEKIHTYNLKIVKVEENNKEENLNNLTKLKGAKYVIESTDKRKEQQYVTDENGEINLSNLYQYVEGKYITGEYKIKEVESPKGYVNEAEQITIVASTDTEGKLQLDVKNKDELSTYKATIVDENNITLVLQNKPLFRLKKIDSETKEPLKNAEFIIYEMNEDGEIQDFAKDTSNNYVGIQNRNGDYIVTTDDEGNISLPLRGGTYKAVEVGYPEGYLMESNEEYFKVENSENEEEVEEETEINYADLGYETVEINYIEDLVEISNNVNEGTNNYSNYLVKLNRDLDFESADSYRSGVVDTSLTEDEGGSGFAPIGNDSSNPFKGIFDGQGHKIKNLYINNNGTNVGLFGYVSYGTIRNLDLSGKVINSSKDTVGGIAGYLSYSTINNCTNNVEVTNNRIGAYVGGIAGRLDRGVVINGCNNGKITSETKTGKVGGISGDTQSSCIYESYNTADINSNAYYIGGITGSLNQNDSIIENSYNTGNITSANGSDSTLGGIAGVSYATIMNCYSTGNVIVTDENYTYVGALVGYSLKDIFNSYYLDSVTATDFAYNEIGVAVDDNYMKTTEFYDALNIDDVWKYNEGNYPTLKEKDGNTVEINYIEDLFKVSQRSNLRLCYQLSTIKLMRTLDFNDDNSYRNPENTSYGDVNGDKTTDSIKTELTTGKGFAPIGNSSYNGTFKGIFDGQGNEIKNILIYENRGTIGMTENAIVKNLKVQGYVKGSTCTGGIVGEAKNSIISGCSFDGQFILSSSSQGGIVGRASNCKIIDCNNIAEFTGTGIYVGGILGQADSDVEIINCYNTSDITSSYVGGIAGSVSYTIKITDCYNTGNIQSGNYAGGIVGYSGSGNDIISKCYNTGDIIGSNAGGIIGSCSSFDIKNSYNTGNIYTTGTGNVYAGGIVGYSYYGKIENTYNIGEIIGNYYGALIAYASDNSRTSVSNSYYPDKITLLGNTINNSGTKLEDAKMKTEEFYNILNVDGVWHYKENDYPILSKIMPSNLIASTEITMENTMKTYKITTEVKGNTGGNISGKNQKPYETVKYKKSNTKEIVMTPNTGYIITSITINGKNLPIDIENESNSYTLPANYFKEMTEDKHVIVTYGTQDNILTIKKVDKDNNNRTLEGAKFNIRKQQSDITNNIAQYNTYCFQKIGDAYMANNGRIEKHGTVAQSAINLSSIAPGKYYVKINAEVSSEENNDYGRVLLVRSSNLDEATTILQISGEKTAQDYQSDIFEVTGEEGETTGIIFQYEKNESISSGDDALYINNVKIYEVEDDGTETEHDITTGIGNAGTEYFAKVDDKYIPTNSKSYITGKANTTANSYSQISLTEPGDYYVEVEAEISSESENDYGFVTISTRQPERTESSGDSFVHISGEVERQTYTSNVFTYSGNENYFVNLGYVKNGTIDGGEDQFRIYSIKVWPVKTETVETNENGIVQYGCTEGTYYIQEIEAPENYILDDTIHKIDVSSTSNKEIIIENKIMPTLTVHHYLEGTENKVADDESYTDEIGEKYTTTPHIDLEKMELTKDEEGEYVIPSNASGIYENREIEVTYYYTPEPIKLTINHYLEGTQESVADQEEVDTEPEVQETDDGKYTVSTVANYKLNTNTNYNRLLSTYNLAMVTSSVEDETNIEDNLTYEEDSEVTYYYSLKEKNITTEVKNHTESRTNAETNEKEDVQVAGGTIELANGETSETVGYGENSTQTIIVTPDENYTIKQITLESTNEDEETTTSIIYGENKVSTPEITYTENQGIVTLSTFENVTEDKKVIVEFEPTYGKVIIHYYIEGTGEEYGNTAVKVDLQNGGKAENIEITDLVGEPYIVGRRADVVDYYVVSSISGETSGNYINGTKNVYFYYKYSEYQYRIEHYYENLTSGEYVIDNIATERRAAEYLENITLAETDKKVKTGYTYKSQTGSPLEITSNSANNVIKLYYDLSKHNYVVKYIDKNTNEEIETQKTVADVKYGTVISSADEVIDIAKYNYVEADKETLTIGTNASENIIRLYYELKDTSVLVHHYIKGTTTKVPSTTEGVVVADETKTGKVDDEYTTSAANNVSNKYKLVETPENAEGVMTVDQIVVTYYYELKPTKVIVKYLEKDSNEVIATQETINGKVDDTYTAEKKTIENYTYVEDTGNTTGQMTIDTIEVIYYYLQNTSAKVQYIDKTTNRVIEEETETGLVGDLFETTAKDFENYVLVEEPEHKTVPMEKEEVVLKYYYIHVAGGVIEKHIDVITNAILDNDVHNGNEGDAYNIPSKEFEGYDLVEERLPTNSTGTMTVEPIEVKYYYIRKAKVITKYIDKITGEELAEEVVQNGHEKDEYTTENKEFEDYDLVELPENHEGTMEIEVIVKDDETEEINDTTTVIYYYAHKSAGVKERHIDIITGELLEKETEHKGHEGDNYSTAAKEFEGYDVVEDKLPENAKGKMTIEEIIVNYYYIYKSTVTAKYVDKTTGEEISEEEVIEGHEGDKYKTSSKEIKGYDIIEKEYPENEEGEITREPIKVVYYYIRPAEVKVQYIDKTTGEEIAETENIYGHENDDYKTEQKEIKYYKFVEDTENTEGKMKVEVLEMEDGTERVNNKTEVKYYYRPLVFNLKIEKEISKILVDGEEKKIGDKDLAKVEIHRKKLNETELVVEYTIKVTNTGELDGGATLIDRIPSGFIMKEGANEGWITKDGIAERKIEKLKVGETKEYKVVLEWIGGEENIGIKENIASLLNTINEAEFKEETEKDNADNAILILSISTGENKSEGIILEIATGIILLAAIGVSITIRRKE